MLTDTQKETRFKINVVLLKPSGTSAPAPRRRMHVSTDVRGVGVLTTKTRSKLHSRSDHHGFRQALEHNQERAILQKKCAIVLVTKDLPKMRQMTIEMY
jgi:hypothetical protein